MCIGTIVLTAFWATFQAHHKSYLRQEEAAAMQQSLRAAMDLIARDIRLAGYDWTGEIGRKASLFTLSSGERNGYAAPGSPCLIQLAMDLNGDGDLGDNNSHFDANEVVSYGFSKSNDHNGDGIADKGAARLGRNTNNGSGFQPLAENIQAIGFAYAFDADGDGGLDFQDHNDNGIRDNGEAIIWGVDHNEDGIWENLDVNGDGTITEADLPGGELPESGNTAAIAGDEGDGIPLNPEEIRAVRIWLLIRAEWQDTGFLNDKVYVVGTQVIRPSDGYHRRLLSTIVYCRNMGL